MKSNKWWEIAGPGNSSDNWEEVFQIFKERLGREIYWERTKPPESECDHGETVMRKLHANYHDYRALGDKYCCDCGWKLQ